jgi:hypothetical protein
MKIVRDLVQHRAGKNASNRSGAPALDPAAGPFDQVKRICDYLQSVLGPLGLKLVCEYIKAPRPETTEMLR